MATQLPPEADMITKELMCDMLSRYEKTHDIEVEHLQVSRMTKPGEHIGSCILRVCVTTKSLDGVSKQHHLVVKTNFTDPVQAQRVTNNLMFVKEIQTFKELLPAANSRIREITAGQDGVTYAVSVPEMVGYRLGEGHTSMLALKDLSTEGYKKVNVSESLDICHCKQAMKEVAAFHAIGYLLKDGVTREAFLTRYPYLGVFNYTSQEFIAPFMDIIRLTSDSLVEFILTSDLSEDLKQQAGKLRLHDPVAEPKSCSAPVEPFATICLLDFSTRNMLFRYDDQGVPVGVKLLDFQTVYYGSPTFDLSMFLYTACFDGIKQDILDDLLSTYYNALADNLKKLRVPLKFTYQEFFKEFMRTRLSALWYGLMTPPFFLIMGGFLARDEVKDPTSGGPAKQLAKALSRSVYAPFLLDTYRLLSTYNFSVTLQPL